MSATSRSRPRSVSSTRPDDPYATQEHLDTRSRPSLDEAMTILDAYRRAGGAQVRAGLPTVDMDRVAVALTARPMSDPSGAALCSAALQMLVDMETLQRASLGVRLRAGWCGALRVACELVVERVLSVLPHLDETDAPYVANEVGGLISHAARHLHALGLVCATQEEVRSPLR